jgi:hypothetical protein
MCTGTHTHTLALMLEQVCGNKKSMVLRFYFYNFKQDNSEKPSCGILKICGNSLKT